MNTDDIKKVIEEVMKGMRVADAPSIGKAPEPPAPPEEMRDLAALDIRQTLHVPDPVNRDAYLKYKSATVARVGIGRTGSRYLTDAYLRFRADHAVAQDAVFRDVSEEFVRQWGILEVQTLCEDKVQYLTRPDLGRMLNSENAEKIKQHCQQKPAVQIYIADGLSSTAVETNAKDTFLALVQGLEGHNVKVGTPFFLRFGRVPSMDAVSEILQPEVTVVLLGERPGLATGESLSCYMAYHATVGMPEARRTVISNIHKGGTPAVEAGAHIADVVKKMLEQKASGLDLKK